MSELKATTAQEIVRNEKDCDYMDELFGGVKMPPTQVYLKSDVDKVLAEKDEEIESLKASHYAEMVDAGMRERKLERALWFTRALRARDIQRWWIAATCAPTTERACRIWNNVERNCRAKAENYK